MTAQTSTIPKDWKMTTLGAVAEIFTGRKDVNQTNPAGKYIFFSCSPETFCSDEYIRDDDAIIIVGNGSYTGTVRFFSGKFDLYQRTYACVLKSETKDEFNIKFLFYYTKKYFEDNFMGGTRGSSIPYIVRGDIENFEIPNLPLPEQRAIASVLSSLDDKIELLCEQSETLEATAQAIFKEWFVNFNFPGATGKMIDSELGKIPEGWRVGKLGEFIDVRGGLSYDGNLISKKGTPMITMGFVSGDKRYEGSGIKYYSGQFNQQHQIKAGSLVIATRDVTQDRKLIGSPAIIPNYFGDITIIAATNLYIVQNINFLPNRFLYWVMRTPDYRERVIGACKGTTIVMITKDSILDYEFVIPKEELVEKFSAINESIFNRLELIDNQIQTLSILRDTLLPKLMKGEVRVEGFNN